MCSLLGGFSDYAPLQSVLWGLGVVVFLGKPAAMFVFRSSGNSVAR